MWISRSDARCVHTAYMDGYVIPGVKLILAGPFWMMSAGVGGGDVADLSCPALLCCVRLPVHQTRPICHIYFRLIGGGLKCRLDASKCPPVPAEERHPALVMQINSRKRASKIKHSDPSVCVFFYICLNPNLPFILTVIINPTK